jgi:cytochrome c oxidase assembly protein subunit 15
VILAVWIWIREPRAWMRRLGWVALGLVIVQGLLGGLTVLMKLPVWTSALHGCVAQTFFMLVVFLALSLGRRWNAPAPSVDRPLAAWSAVTTGVIYVQLVLGAVMRHMNAGLVVPDFPLAFGRLWPPIMSPEIAVHLAHRLWAIAVVAAAATLWIRARRSGHPELTGPAGLLMALVLVQIALGASVIWSARQPHVTSTHVVTGALILGTSTLLTAMAWRRTMATEPYRHPAALRRRSEVPA